MIGFEQCPTTPRSRMTPKQLIVSATLISVVALGSSTSSRRWPSSRPTPSHALIEDTQNPADPFFIAISEYGDPVARDGDRGLHPHPGAFACAIAFHNAAMRYYYAMAGRRSCARPSEGRTPRTSPLRGEHVPTVIALALRAGVASAPGSTSPTGSTPPTFHIYTMIAVPHGLADRHPDRVRASPSISNGSVAASANSSLDRHRHPGHRHRRPGVRALPAASTSTCWPARSATSI